LRPARRSDAATCPKLRAAALVERDGWSWETGEFGDGLTGVGDRQSFSALGALDDLAALVAEIADRDISHRWDVSGVRQNLDRMEFCVER